MDGPQAPSNQDPDARDERVSACLSEYHALRAAGKAVQASQFKGRLTPEEFDFFDTLLDMDTLLEDPQPSVNNAALPRTFGDYTLLREVGSGATGVVYEGVEHGLRRSVAIKVLRASFGGDDIVRERFLREADACSQIDHPNVVTVFHSGEAEGHPFYAMTFVDGRPLSDMLGSNELDVRDVCRRAAEVADALGEMHKAGIIHRDVKPGNIMESPDGRWHLTDFGHVHDDAALTLTKSGDALGTPLYMSPEQARGVREIDGRMDVYGLGATLYHLVTGTPVFTDPDIQGLMRAVLMDRAESMQRRMVDVPADLDRVILKCLEKRPEDRYENMAELAADLRAVAEGRSASGRPLSRTRRILRWIPEHPGRMAAAALILIGFAGALLWPRTPTLQVDTLTGAIVSLEGHADREAPIADAIPIKIGTNILKVSRKGFRSRTIPVEAKSGSEIHRHIALAPEDPDDGASRDMLLAFLGVLQHDAQPLMAHAETNAKDERSVTRAPLADLATIAVYPRGKITLDELDRCFVSVSLDLMDADIVWKHAGKELARQPLPDEDLARAEIPAAVRKALKTGDTLHWSVESDGKVVSEASAQIVDMSTKVLEAARYMEVELKMSAAEQRPAMIRAWLTHGFFTRALREVEAGGADASRSIAQFRLIALEGLCGASNQKLRDSKVWESAWTAFKSKR